MNLFLRIPIIIIFLALLTDNVSCNNSTKIYRCKDLISKSLEDYVDLTVDPCTNFYSFACGKMVEKKNVIRSLGQNQSIIESEYNFNDFYEDFKKGRFDKESLALEKIRMMRRKCENEDELYRDDCFEKVDNFGYYAMASHFSSLLYNELSRRNWIDSISSTVDNLKNRFKRLIRKKNKTLDKKTRNNYLLKISNMTFGVGEIFLENSKGRLYMERCYELFNFSTKDDVDRMLENIRNYTYQLPKDDEEFRDNCLNYIKHAKSGDLRLEDLLYSYTFYIPEENKIIVNPLVFNSMCYNNRYPDALNYGCAGFHIGHEMFHAIDNEGMFIDQNGNESKNFTTPKSRKNINRKKKCYIKKYDKKWNKDLLLEETVADNGGIKIAYEAYLNICVNLRKKSSNIPKFEQFNNDQLFFINVARSICSTPEMVSDNEYDNNLEFPPKRTRIWRLLSNYKSFSRAFKCKRNSKMNPRRKCQVW